jgi:hypothetical protein
LKAKALDVHNTKFNKLTEKMQKEARKNMDELDMISLDMEIAAAEDLAESNKKEEVNNKMFNFKCLLLLYLPPKSKSISCVPRAWKGRPLTSTKAE